MKKNLLIIILFTYSMQAVQPIVFEDALITQCINPLNILVQQITKKEYTSLDFFTRNQNVLDSIKDLLTNYSFTPDNIRFEQQTTTATSYIMVAKLMKRKLMKFKQQELAENTDFLLQEDIQDKDETMQQITKIEEKLIKNMSALKMQLADLDIYTTDSTVDIKGKNISETITKTLSQASLTLS